MPIVTEFVFQSTSLAVPTPSVLALPDRAAPLTGWPVVLLLHGRGRDHRSITSHPRFAEWFARRRFALLCPHGHDGWWIDSPTQPESRYQSMLVELLAHARAAPLAHDARYTGVLGWSMGGYGAARFACDHPDLVTALVTIIGLLDFPNADDPTYVVPAVMGDRAGWPTLDPINQAPSLRGKAVLLLAANRAFDFQMNLRFHARLTASHIEHHYEEFDGEHHIAAVEHAMPLAFDFLDAHFNRQRAPVK